MKALIDVPPGLNGVAVAETAVGDVDGEAGYYHYREHAAVELARSVSFEEVWYLLEHHELPDAASLAQYRTVLAELRQLPAELGHLVDAIALHSSAHPLAQLRAVLSAAGPALGVTPMLDATSAQRLTQARRVAALVPTILARLHRATAGGDGEPPTDRLGHVELGHAELGHAAAYLAAVTGAAPTPAASRALEQCLILTIDHGLNASTFTGRVVASTGAGIVDVVCAALGALAGPLHGGAPSRALDALDAIGEPERAGRWVRAEIAAGRRIMGFGHAVYRAPDPRSALLREIAAGLGGELVERAIATEAAILATLAELKPDRPLPSNVEFYAGVIMETIGLPRHMFTPTFAVGRTVGWCAHALEQSATGKLIRPSARYVGPAPHRR